LILVAEMSANEAAERLEFMAKRYTDKPEIRRTLLYAVSLCRKLAAGELREVKHGEWLNFYGDFSTAECSECGQVYEVSPDENPKEEFSIAYRTLITVPASDCNFIWALQKYATRDDLLKAQYYLEDHPAWNKSRLRAVNQEIRRRQQEARNG
jgi:hypothetical protein